ncbi:MAG TPA: protein kinase [Thermoanaerobaculia bacterium]|jgi:tetratricopeptide (TPR) repeat protein|nr:protein kinase [Thermoanaerobaculia bacterium]
MAKGGFFSQLFGDPLEQAAVAEKDGRRKEALRLYAKGGDFRKAAILAAGLGRSQEAVNHTLSALFGKIPAGYEDLDARQAGELLAKAGHREEALALFDLAQAWPQAADTALKLQQPGRAARYFERAKSYREAALYYQRAGQVADAARVLEIESNRLKQALRTRPDPVAEEALRKVELERATILSRQGKSSEAGDLLKGGTAAATPRSARLLEQSGNVREAIEAFLTIGEPAEALRLLAQNPTLDRRFQAESYRKAGKPVEAGQLFVSAGAMREAAECFEQATDFARAGNAWEAAKEPLRAAQAYLRGERWSEAGRSFLSANQPEVAARAFSRAGDPRGAASAYEKAGKPREAAQALLQAGDRAQAARVLRAVPKDDPGYVAAVLALVPILIDEKAYDEALARLQPLTPRADSAAGSGAAGAEIYYWQGRVLEALGSAPEAVTRFRQALALKPDQADAAQRALALSAGLQATQRFPSPAKGSPSEDGPTQALRMAQAPPSGEWPTGFRLAGRYEILGELGKGGMGRVYKARDHELDDLVAIKTVLRSGDGSVGAEHEERLLREIQICRKITHPNVVRVYDLGRFPGGIFITMEYLEGARLDSLIRRDATLQLDKIRWVLTEIATGLEEAHALHVIHRDLKPSNVILAERHLKILDFGVARMAGDARLTQTGFAVGSPLYMSPEQLQGLPLDGRSDLYALGVVAYTLLTGYEPFTGGTMTLIAMSHLQSPIPDPRRKRPDLPLEWVKLVEKLLAKTAEERPADASAALAAIRALPV